MPILTNKRKRNIRVITGMIIGTIIYCIGVVWFLDLGRFYAGGVTGFSQLLTDFLALFNIRISKSIFIALLNIPLFIIGWQGVSKRFAILSVASVALQVLVIAFLEMLVARGFNPFEKALLPDGEITHGTLLTLAVLGGLVTGIGSGISLRSGASTGGMDIISQYFSFKKSIPFTTFSLFVDGSIIFLSAFVGTLSTAIFTIIRLIITMLVLDRIHTIYKYMRVQIITIEKEAMRTALLESFNHGVTIYPAIGAFSGQERWVFESVVSSYEAEEYKNLALRIDKSAFITFTAIKQIYGLFHRNAIT
jgi:uncharacterized membrane-anchored protein YitT (DUF2179 family)